MSETGVQPVAGRPITTAGYGISSGPEGTLPWSWAEEQLAKSRNYWVCTTRPDGRPHAIPVWGLWLGGAVVFSTDPESRKGRNLAADPRVVVHLESGDDVVVVEGVVEIVRGAGVPASFSDDYQKKYAFRPEPGPDQVVYIVTPAVVLGWRETDFPKSATRWVFAAQGRPVR
jgi:PPOX class probable F420-dependent enzyme